MKKTVYLFLVLLFVGVCQQGMAVPVTSYPSISTFDSNLGPWESSGSSGSYWYSTSYQSSYYNGTWDYIYPNQGTGFATMATTDRTKNGFLSATFDLSSLADPSISFDYHMNRDIYNNLYLYASTDGGVNFNYVDLWGVSGQLGDTWYSTNISLSAYAGVTNLTLFFSGHPSSDADWVWDISLDNVIVQGTAVSSDTDEDGIPNEWEETYFGGPTNANPSANPDLDHYSNLEEYIAGLNPTVSDGLFLTGFTVNGNKVFNWTPQSGRVYSVYWTDNLANGFTLLQGNLTSGTYTDTAHGAAAGGYYKLTVEVAAP